MATKSSLSSISKRKEIPFDSASLEIFNSLGIGMILIDQDRKIRFRNSLASQWTPQTDRFDTIFEGAKFLAPFEGWDRLFAALKISDESVQINCVVPLPGEAIPILINVRCTPICSDDAGRSAGYVILLDRRSHTDGLEDQIEVSKRLASLGKLATRVAHELNNPLDGILRYVNLALRVIEDESETKLKTYLDESRTGLVRMTQIIGDLLEFSRSTDGEFDELDINEVIEQAIRSSASRADTAKVIITADFQQSSMPIIRGSRLYQVCLNLIRNAIDAMPDGGRLQITSGVLGSDVVIRVSDTGVGLPKDSSKIFEPFYTTKESGKGTGIGLAICKDFIQQMGGTIESAAGLKGGAVFTVKIPIESCQAKKNTLQEGVMQSQSQSKNNGDDSGHPHSRSNP